MRRSRRAWKRCHDKDGEWSNARCAKRLTIEVGGIMNGNKVLHSSLLTRHEENIWTKVSSERGKLMRCSAHFKVLVFPDFYPDQKHLFVMLNYNSGMRLLQLNDGQSASIWPSMETEIPGSANHEAEPHPFHMKEGALHHGMLI